MAMGHHGIITGAQASSFCFVEERTVDSLDEARQRRGGGGGGGEGRASASTARVGEEEGWLVCVRFSLQLRNSHMNKAPISLAKISDSLIDRILQGLGFRV